MLLLLSSVVILPLIHQVLYKVTILFTNSTALVLLCGQSWIAFFFLVFLVRPWEKREFCKFSLKYRMLLFLRSLIAISAHLLWIYSLNHFSFFYTNLASYAIGSGLALFSIVFLESCQWYKILGLVWFAYVGLYRYTVHDYFILFQQGAPFFAAVLFSLSSLLAKVSIRFCPIEDMACLLLWDMSWVCLLLLFYERGADIVSIHFFDSTAWMLVVLLGLSYAVIHLLMMFTYRENHLSTIIFLKPLRSLFGFFVDQSLHFDPVLYNIPMILCLFIGGAGMSFLAYFHPKKSKFF